MDPAIRVFAFGDLAITVDGVAVSAGPPKQRMLLALLLCRRGTEVPSGELISALWHERSPDSARNNLRTYVHGLRRILGEDVLGGSGRPGYRLHGDRLWIDTDRFLALCGAAEHALKHDDRKTAREALAEALALRRGAAYGHTGLPAVDDEADRLDERWLLAAEQRIELDLRDGVAAEIVGELTSLTRQHPYREKLIGLLMLALYRSGRQTDALATYRRTAAALSEELGVEPGVHLAELHRAMLRQDRELDVPAAEPPAPADPAEMSPGPGHVVGRARERADPGRSIAARPAEHRADTGADALRIAGDVERALPAAFNGPVRGLTAGQQRLLALLSLVPGPSVTAEAAVALAGGLRAQVETDLLRLINAHVIRRTAAYRFAFHDLIREYVRSRVPAGDGDDRSAAMGRLYDFYVDVSDAADRILHPGAPRVSTGDARAADRFAGDERAAESWFEEELPNLLAACREAADDDNGRAAIRLADIIGRRLRDRGDLDTWTTIAETGARAAIALGDLRGQAAAQLALARIADGRGDVITVAARSGEAARLARRAGWREAEAAARSSVAAQHR